ncbi:BRCT domain-containing protein [Aspergillus cavernicola]|uniref:BRCT domain-containing protein n=1 Tax=Aspergillus cavernicola TaxID=176166 RepID=A0ABR4IFP6_9EURO
MAGNAASNKEHPLAGVVLCFTSIPPEQRTDIASIASQMGASHKYDLTSDVTHMLVGETNTPKYKFVARERPDVIVLKPEWVEAVRQSWMQGGDTDIHSLEEQYKLPAFTGTAICITGFEDMAFRNYIRSNVLLHGSDFRGDLTKTVTHLIARSAEGEKYKFATSWSVKIVSFKWFTDSIERGMALDEDLYHPLIPVEQQGIGAWNRSLPAVKQKLPANESSSNPRPRKLRRIASAKLVDQNENIWGDIVGMGFETAEPKPSREERLASYERKSRDASVIQIAKSFASETVFTAPSQSHEQPTEPIVNRRDGFLDDCFFLIHGFSSKQTKVLRHHLSFNGARLVDSLGEFSRPDIPKRGDGLYIIVPYKTPLSEAPSTDDLAFECEVVTDMWLERCLEAKALVPPESHIANTPISSFPINGLSGLKICSTGISRIDLLHLSKLVNLVGATYHEYLTPKVTVLLCNKSININNEKLRHTHEWGVPAVTIDWLWASIRQEKKQPFEPYLIRRPSTLANKDLKVRAGTRPEQKRTSRLTPEDNTTLQQTTNVPNIPNQSKTLDPASITASEPKQAIADSPRKQSMPEPSNSFNRKSTSPTKLPPKNTLKSPSTKRKAPDHQPPGPSAKSALDQAVNGLLKQSRAANSRSAADTSGEHDRIRSRKPRPLLGRAQSNSSGRTTEQKAFSRASSIDTLNEDGCGSAVESINTDTGIPSLANSGRFEFEYPEGERAHERGNEDDEDETPPMTQLDYEDPDAVAMREKFLRYAGKIVEKPSSKQQLVIGEVKELEQVGWGTGRRTRNAHKVAKDDDDEF